MKPQGVSSGHLLKSCFHFMQKTLLYAFVLLFVLSCQPNKDDNLVTPDPAPEPEKKCRLMKLIQGTHNGAAEDTTFNFYYDASGKLNKVIYFQTYNGKLSSDTIKITYNDSGRLASVIGSYYRRANYFKYNTNGSLAEATATGGLYDTIRFRYDYASSTVPQKSMRYQYSYSKKWDTAEYRYTYQNGNIVTVESFYPNNISVKRSYDYDTIPNVNADLILMGLQSTVPVGYFDEFLYFNKNALKRYTSTVNNYTSAYYINYKTDSGRITKSVLNWLKSPALTDTSQRDTRNYFYECQ
jgi:hypothetical protein